MAPKTTSLPLVCLLFVMLIVLSTFSETASAQTFPRTCRKNGGIVKRANKAETCDDCRALCRKKCPDGTFMLEQMFCIRAPCPQPNHAGANLALHMGACTVQSPNSSLVTCSCCCVDHFIPN
ncbi:hypothetical protein MKW94_016804 [Papaver nudicaule]|uniref:Uncharacterized protein n=1 Tax=Papaver nudicaule TaxID=74823 RepID=A0AA41VSL6_PAPNU|nr:hypothetical protein [Papaver nudicaule]